MMKSLVSMVVSWYLGKGEGVVAAESSARKIRVAIKKPRTYQLGAFITQTTG